MTKALFELYFAGTIIKGGKEGEFGTFDDMVDSMLKKERGGCCRLSLMEWLLTAWLD